jgi:glutamate-1-semialdehyde 2,1-aminomutase
MSAMDNANRAESPATDRESILTRAAKVIPNGASAAGRAEPRDVIVRAQGAYLWNSEGKRYIDYLLSWGPIVVGHCDPRVDEAVTRAASTCDLMWVGPQPGEVELAEAISEVMPCAEKVNFFPTGTDALLHAVHLARAVTGRRRLLMFHGSYNGWVDDLAVGSRFGYGDTAPAPYELNSAGLHPGAMVDAVVVEWNDFEGIRAAFAEHGSELAGAFCEPYVHTFGCVPPEPGFLEALRDLCSRHGALLVYDEVKTGFRAHLGGYQAICGVTPDLAAFGKAVGNGWTLAGLAGRAEAMDHLGEASPTRVDTNGTYNAQPYALAAGLATLEILRDGGIERLYELGDRMRSGLAQAITDAGVEASAAGLGSEWTLYFRSDPPRNYKEAAHDHDHERGEAYLEAMLEEGVLEPPLVIGDRRLCLATTEDDVDATIEAAARALRRVA